MNTRAESNLILAVYFIKNQDRVSRDVTFGDMTLVGVMKLSGKCEMEEYAMEGSIATLRVQTNDWSNIFEVVEEYLHTSCGENGTPM